MKLLLITASLMIASLPVIANDADDAYRRGMEAVKQGDVEAARSAFTETLRLKPDHAYARFQLGKLKTNQGQMIASRRSSQLAAVRLDKIDMNHVTFGEALEALDHMVHEKTKAANPEKPYSPNFMIKDRSGELQEREVSLRLNNVPAKVALDYLLEQAGGKARFDEHATVVTPAPQSR